MLMSGLFVRRWRAPLLVALMLSLGVCLGGCGSAKNTAVVSGKVTYNGESVTGGKIELYDADNPDEQPIPGDIKGDGTFGFGGVTPGKKKVVVLTEHLNSSGAKPGMGPNLPGRPPMLRGNTAGAPPDKGHEEDWAKLGGKPKYVKIPMKYSKKNTTDLVWDVQNTTTPQSFNIELKD
jgi:hypothetical protein